MPTAMVAYSQARTVLDRSRTESKVGFILRLWACSYFSRLPCSVSRILYTVCRWQLIIQAMKC